MQYWKLWNDDGRQTVEGIPGHHSYTIGQSPGATLSRWNHTGHTPDGRDSRRDFGIPRPRIAVAGLNPHSGEVGMFGEEEMQVIEPAVSAAVSKKWDVVGPLPPDTVFKKAMDNDYDAVIAMYHDQGLIPFKLVHFEDGVNLTMGLPIIRTSVDHGTAYDIAGKGLASDSSLEAAFALAAQIISNRSRIQGKIIED